MERFDERLREMAEREAVATPEGFDGRLREALDGLPPRTKKRRGPGAVKTVLIAAAVCAAMLCTAFAASPGLREMLAEALGGFAPVAQELDSQVYTWNGFEIKALSAMADGSTLRVYVQVRDVEKRGRLVLEPGSEEWDKEYPAFVVGGIRAGEGIDNGGSFIQSFGQICSYDEATQTAVVETGVVGKLAEDLSEAKVMADTWASWFFADYWEPPLTIPVSIEIMPNRTVLEDVELCGLPVEEVRLSALGITVEFEKIHEYMEDAEMDLSARGLRVKMKDGTIISTADNYSEGSGNYRNLETGKRYEMIIWHFADPVDADQAVGLYVGENYYPFK